MGLNQVSTKPGPAQSIGMQGARVGMLMPEDQNLLSGLGAIGVGLLVLMNWRWLVDSSIRSGDESFGRLGIPQASETVRRRVGEIIVKTLGVLLILFGVLVILKQYS